MLHLIACFSTLAHVNLRTEKVGRDKTRPAADLKFVTDIPNTQLEEIEPGLLQALYRGKDEGGHQGDLMANPEALTTPRFPKAKPFQPNEDWPGYALDLSHGSFDAKAIELDKVTLKGISLTAKNGGTVELSFSLGCHPEPADIAILYDLMGQDVEIELAPPSLEALRQLRESAKKGAAAAQPDPDDEDEEEDEDQGPPSDAAVGRAFPDAIDARGDTPPSVRKTQARAAGGSKAPAKPKGKAKPAAKKPTPRRKPSTASAHVH